MSLDFAVISFSVQQNFTEDIFFKWIFIVISYLAIFFSVIKLWAWVILVRWFIRMWGVITLSWRDAIGGENPSIESWSLDLFELLHSLAMLFEHLLYLLLLIWSLWMQGWEIPFELQLVSDHKWLKTENIDVAFVLEWGNDSWRNLTLLKDTDQYGWNVLILRKGLLVILVYAMLVDFFSKLSHSFFAVWDLIDKGRVHFEIGFDLVEVNNFIDFDRIKQ